LRLSLGSEEEVGRWRARHWLAWGEAKESHLVGWDSLLSAGSFRMFDDFAFDLAKIE
jgi:hypothetical protein